MSNGTVVARTSDCELVVTRTFNGPAQIIFDAWTKPELLKRGYGDTLLNPPIDLASMHDRMRSKGG
jgi:uncharacterized protein YndB with AHSA1/START domain